MVSLLGEINFAKYVGRSGLCVCVFVCLLVCLFVRLRSTGHNSYLIAFKFSQNNCTTLEETPRNLSKSIEKLRHDVTKRQNPKFVITR